MTVWREVLVWAIFAAIVASPAFGQNAASATQPDFSGVWRHPSWPGFEPLPSGPTSLINLAGNKGRNGLIFLVGDYTNPILKPHAAEIVKRRGEKSLAGGFPTPSTQCTPGGVPYILASFGMQMLQQPQQVTLIYDHPLIEFRKVRMNEPHASPLRPSWYGDSVGHYEGDTLVIDTMGVRVGPFSMADLLGTPFTPALHVVERYRMLDYEAAKEGLDRDAKWNIRFPGYVDPNYRGKHLQLTFTVDDEGAFTMPWSATVTYGRGPPKPPTTDWEDHVCAENPSRYYGPPPTADKPDF
jgi:hypothetical protein